MFCTLYSIFYAIRSTLRTTHYILHTTYDTLHTAYHTIHTTYYILHITYTATPTVLCYATLYYTILDHAMLTDAAMYDTRDPRRI